MQVSPARLRIITSDIIMMYRQTKISAAYTMPVLVYVDDKS